MNRRHFLATALAALTPSIAQAGERKPQRILLRSSWQTVNIGGSTHAWISSG